MDNGRLQKVVLDGSYLDIFYSIELYCMICFRIILWYMPGQILRGGVRYDFRTNYNSEAPSWCLFVMILCLLYLVLINRRMVFGREKRRKVEEKLNQARRERHRPSQIGSSFPVLIYKCNYVIMTLPVQNVDITMSKKH